MSSSSHGLKGTIPLSSANGELIITDSLTIDGPGANKLTVSGSNVTRVFHIENLATVTVAGLTIANGMVVDDGGGGIKNEGDATLNLNCVVVANNTAYGIGGGLWNRVDGGTVNISNSQFVGNKSIGSLAFNYPDEGIIPGMGTAEGGAIDNDGAASISNSTFTDNLAASVTGTSTDPNYPSSGAHGGAIGSDGPLTVSGCTFTSNKARAADGASGGPGADGGSGGQAEAGAIVLYADSNVSYSVFTNNVSIGGNGGNGGGSGGNGGVGVSGAIELIANVTLANCMFTGNQAKGGAGGNGGSGGNGGAGGLARGGAFVHSGGSTSNLSGVAMWNNQAIGGGGGSGGAGGNGGDGLGGGIRAIGGHLNVSHSLLGQNQAVGGDGGAAGTGGALGGNGGNGKGGGIYIGRSNTAVVSDTALLLNLAQGGAGAARQRRQRSGRRHLHLQRRGCCSQSDAPGHVCPLQPGRRRRGRPRRGRRPL